MLITSGEISHVCFAASAFFLMRASFPTRVRTCSRAWNQATVDRLYLIQVKAHFRFVHNFDRVKNPRHRPARVLLAFNTYPQPSGGERWKRAIDAAADLGIDAVIFCARSAALVGLALSRPVIDVQSGARGTGCVV
jgi:hypothetical protein